jgi:DNA-binding NarL/FixJ family response regulator
VLVTEGDAEAALVELRRAFHQFNTLGARHDAARTRLLISEACTALGDHDAAAMEARAGHSVLDALCVGVTARRARTDSPEGLTQRELEVLRLLAQGKTNRAIAGELVVSEKTVASHVSHIFTKLGLTSRSAATAYAYAHDLV